VLGALCLKFFKSDILLFKRFSVFSLFFNENVLFRACIDERMSEEGALIVTLRKNV